MTDEVPASLDIAAFYRPLVSRAAYELLLRACAEVAGFRELAQRSSSARFMAIAVESVVSTSSDVNEWLVKVTAHYLDALDERPSSNLLETIAHEDFLLGECHGYNTEYIADVCPLRDGSDASDWLRDTGTNSVGFSNTLVRDYFLARYIIVEGSSQLLRFEYPRRWVLLFLAILAPELVTLFTANRTDQIRAEIELEVEQKVQAALSHQLKRSAGAVRSHLKSLRRKLAPDQFDGRMHRDGPASRADLLLPRAAHESRECIMNYPDPNSILVVEDHDSSAADYVRWLAESGYRVTRASARSDALTEAKRSRPDVVVLDLKLPSDQSPVVQTRMSAMGSICSIDSLATTHFAQSSS